MTDMDPRNRRIVRGGLAVLAVATAPIAIWATIAPHSFYDSFPGAGRSWVAPLGPYDEHLVRDVGAFELGLLVLAVFAVVVAERRVMQAALLAFAVAGLPHLLFHLFNTEPLSTGDNAASLAGLALLVIVPLALLPLTRARRATASEAGVAAGPP